MDIFARLADEHNTLYPLIVSLQAVAEAGDHTALLERLIAGRAELTSGLDAHIALEEDVAFALIEEAVGEELITPFRAEHIEIRSLRDEVLRDVDANSIPVGPCLQLCDLLQQHMQREDAMLFPSAYNAFDPHM